MTPLWFIGACRGLAFASTAFGGYAAAYDCTAITCEAYAVAVACAFLAEMGL